MSRASNSPGDDSAFSETAQSGLIDLQAQETREQLLNQFYATLRVQYLSSDLSRDETKTIREQIEGKLGGTRSWRGVYEIEQLLAFVVSDEQVTAELPRRMVEAKKVELPCATFSMLIQSQRRVSEGSLEHLNVASSWHTST